MDEEFRTKRIETEVSTDKLTHRWQTEEVKHGDVWTSKSQLRHRSKILDNDVGLDTFRCDCLDLRLYSKTPTIINSLTSRIEHLGSEEDDDDEEADEHLCQDGKEESGARRRNFHHGNFLRYKYPTQFHRSDSGACFDHGKQKQIRDRLPASLRPNFRYGKEPKLQSANGSRCRANARSTGRGPGFPEYPARFRNAETECEILRVVEQSDKSHQVAVQTSDVQSQCRVETQEQACQKVVQVQDTEVQTKVAVLKDSASQVKPDSRNKLTETSVRILYHPEVNTRHNWTQSELSQCVTDSSSSSSSSEKKCTCRSHERASLGQMSRYSSLLNSARQTGAIAFETVPDEDQRTSLSNFSQTAFDKVDQHHMERKSKNPVLEKSRTSLFTHSDEHLTSLCTTTQDQ